MVKKREQMIVFVYDTSFCQTEEDDPQKAVLFFHPKWVSDQQRLALCGQLMGAAYFCSSAFSTPQVLTLQSGKFIIKKYDQYILSVGSDQTLPDWILNERFHMLQSLLEFYHKSFHSILSSVNSEYELFCKKIYEIFEIYSPLIEYIVSTFGNLPAIKLPRKKSAMFLEAFQFLESCCTFEGVLGGTILHNSRVIATLLDPDVTKILALTDPHRVRCGGEQIKTPFHLPVGVQLIKVYVRHSAYASAATSGTSKSSCNRGDSKRNENASQGLETKQEFMKMFTVPEEESGNSGSCSVKEAKDQQFSEVNRKRNRKYHKSKSFRDRSRNFVLNRSIKVCSTPTIEKKFILDDLVSICSKPKVEPKPMSRSSSVTRMSEVIQLAIKPKQSNKFMPTKYTYNTLNRISMDDLMIDLSNKNYPVPLRYYSFGFPRIYEADQTVKDEKNTLRRTRFYKTIADPLHPLFRCDGLPISKSLYNHCLNEHYKDYITANITIDSREEFIRMKNMENQLFKLKNDKKTDESKHGNSSPAPASNEKKSSGDETAGAVPGDKAKELTKSNQKLFRRSLTLPLKPASHIGSDNASMSVAKSKVLHARTPTTPLMTKLSLLVLEEQNDNKGTATVIQQPQNRIKKTVKDHLTDKQRGTNDNKNIDVTKCGLFVYGQQNLTILLLLDENVEQSPDLILSLWELCATGLEKVDVFRDKSIDYVSTVGVTNYNFLSLDPHLGAMQKSGVWGNDEIKAVGSLHQDLIQSPNITEIIVRNEDAVIYGYRCGNTETFYHQGGCTAVGLPTPGDLMGTIPLKARRRLERDHGIILL